METTGNYGSTLDPNHTEEASLVGPAAAPDQQAGLAGTPERTPEEQERILEALKEKKELGLYSEKDLLEAGGKKITVDPANANLGIDAQNSDRLVKHSSGAWLDPSHKEYEQTLNEVTAGGGENKIPEKTRQENKQTEHQELEDAIKNMIAIDTGSSNPHQHMDSAAQARLLAGASITELKTLKPIVAAVDGFAAIEAADVNPEMLGHMHPDSVNVPGMDKIMEGVRARKEKDNEQFAELLRRKEKEKKA
jgi:hypothetical protein